MALHAAEPAGQFPCLFLPGVDPAGQGVLENDPPAGFPYIVPARLQDLIDGPGVCDRHRHAADFIVRRVQGHAQRHRQVFLRERVHIDVAELPSLNTKRLNVEGLGLLDHSFATALGLLRVGIDTLAGAPEENKIISKISKLLQK